jgi:hypothetical protein
LRVTTSCSSVTLPGFCTTCDAVHGRCPFGAIAITSTVYASTLEFGTRLDSAKYTVPS